MSGNFVTIDQSWYERPAGTKATVSCGGVVCRVESGRVLVALAGEHDLVQYVLPKGRLEPGEAPEQAARREIGEETGITDLHLLADLGTLERLSFDKQDWKLIRYFLYGTHQVDAVATDAKHRGLGGWFPVDDLPPMLWPEQANLLRSRRNQIVERVIAWERASR